MKYKQIWKTAASCLVAALMFPSCSDDEGGGSEVQDDKYRTLMITLNSLGNQEIGTRAESAVPDGEKDSQDEHFISRYWLVVLKQDADDEFKVDRIIDSEDPEYSVPGNANEDSETELGVEVEVGQTYRFYALANLDGLANGTDVIAALDALKTGVAFDPTKIINATVKDMDKYPHDTDGQSYIPMTSYGYDETITPATTHLTDDEGKPESIALIRLIGKASVSINNLTNSEVKLSGLTMQPMRKGDIFLFPYDVSEGTQCLFKEDMIDEYMPDFGDMEGTPYSIEFVDEEITVPKNTELKDVTYRYLPETSWSSGEDLTITSVITGRNPYPQSIHTSFIRRNDYLKIPLQITPVSVQFEVMQQHMPIGGYPADLDFPAYEANIPIIDVETDHAGKITFTYTITVDNPDLFDTPAVLYRPAGYVSNVDYTHATIISNTNEVLYGLEEGEEIYWSGDGTLTGSLELTVQELATESKAQVQLLLVIVESGEKVTPDSKRLAIPYTINLTFSPS